MHKNLSWWVLVLLGLVCEAAGRLIEGVIGNAIGTLGLLLLIFGIIQGLREWWQKRGKNQGTTTPPVQ
jgi:hypothetical protein